MSEGEEQPDQPNAPWGPPLVPDSLTCDGHSAGRAWFALAHERLRGCVRGRSGTPAPLSLLPWWVWQWDPRPGGGENGPGQAPSSGERPRSARLRQGRPPARGRACHVRGRSPGLTVYRAGVAFSPTTAVT